MPPEDVKISGVVIPLLTPFTPKGEINSKAYEAHIHWLIERGIGGLMPCGTTGEGPLLSFEERQTLMRLTVQIAAKRVPVMAHVGCITTAETLKLAQAAEDAGADAISIVTPYYYKLPDPAMVAHYVTIAQSVPNLPVFLYTIPHCTSNDLSLEAVRAICEKAPNVVGLKDSAGSLEKMIRYTTLKGGRFQVICGSDGLLLEALKQGAAASVSGNANAYPEVVVGLVQAFQAGDMTKARALQTLLDLIRKQLQDGGNLSLIKKALETRGLTGGAVRPPLPDASPQAVEAALTPLTQDQNLQIFLDKGTL